MIEITVFPGDLIEIIIKISQILVNVMTVNFIHINDHWNGFIAGSGLNETTVFFIEIDCFWVIFGIHLYHSASNART